MSIHYKNTRKIKLKKKSRERCELQVEFEDVFGVSGPNSSDAAKLQRHLIFFLIC